MIPVIKDITAICIFCALLRYCKRNYDPDKEGNKDVSFFFMLLFISISHQLNDNRGPLQVFLYLLKLHLCPPDLKSLGVTAGSLGPSLSQPEDGLQEALDLLEEHANQIDTAKVLPSRFILFLKALIAYF